MGSPPFSATWGHDLVLRTESDGDAITVDGDGDGSAARHEPVDLGPERVGDGALLGLVPGTGRVAGAVTREEAGRRWQSDGGRGAGGTG